MEYIREMLLRQRTALGRLMLGGGSAEEPETAAASPATERTSPAAPAPWETDGTASGTGGWEIRGNSFAGAGADRQTGPTRRGRRCGWSWPGSVQNGSIRPPSDRLAPERPPILPGGGIP